MIRGRNAGNALMTKKLSSDMGADFGQNKNRSTQHHLLEF